MDWEMEVNEMNDLPAETISSYITSARFWFDSFQNWQSEFLSVFAIVFLSIFLREKGSPQSKPVDAPTAKQANELFHHKYLGVP
jgi:hypothetical protein